MGKGKKMAVLVGCNYPKTQYELHGCQNDVLAMQQVIIDQFEFDPTKVELLTDHPGSLIMPTGANIKKALDTMVDKAEPGDVLLFHYSGHGTWIKHGFLSKNVEAIVPCDFNLITSVDFRMLVNRVPEGATFTFLSDSCHSGGLIDKETEQIGPFNVPEEEALSYSHKPKMIPFQSMIQTLTSLTNINTSDMATHLIQLFGSDASLMFTTRLDQHDSMAKPLKPDQGILLSGCQDNETSADVESMGNGRIARGAFSYAIERALKENPGKLSNRQVVQLARNILKMQNFKKQHPCLYCSDENADAIFLSQPDQP